MLYISPLLFLVFLLLNHIKEPYTNRLYYS